MLGYVLKSMRPQQWYKNLLLLAGIVFSKHLFNSTLWGKVILGFLLFCLLSSSVYIANDIFDRRLDLLHEIKKNRPIARGLLPLSYALSAFLLLALFSLASSFFGFPFLSGSAPLLSIDDSLFKLSEDTRNHRCHRHWDGVCLTRGGGLLCR